MAISDRLPNGGESAAKLRVPNARIVSIEHVAKVRNIDNGLKSLGGEPQLRHVLDHHVGDSAIAPLNHREEPVVGVSLRPKDPFAKKIASVGIDTRNLLIKVTLPKRTGRKRKRGSDEPFAEPVQPAREDDSITAPDLLKRLRDNEQVYNIEPVGMIDETHRFRSLPDFQLRTGDIPIMQELREHLKPSYESLRHFYIDPTPGPQGITAFPAPPSFVAIDQPYRWEYVQAQGVKFKTDEQGNISSTNEMATRWRTVKAVLADVAVVPDGPPPGLTQHSSFGIYLPQAIEQLSKLLQERPLVTRRVAMNHIPQYSDTIFKEATQWVGYSFKTGPWRDTLIRYGVDPRKDPKYRFYQTMMFQLDKVAAKAAGEQSSKWTRSIRHVPDEDWQSHVFDGENVTLNGKTWQVCDVTDPVIHDILHTADLSESCDVKLWGWYHPGTLSKARVIMRDKMEFLFADKAPPETTYKALATLPDRMTEEVTAQDYVPAAIYGERAAQMAAEIKRTAKWTSRREDRTKSRAVSEKKKAKKGAEVVEPAEEGGGQEIGEGRVQEIEDDEQGDFDDLMDDLDRLDAQLDAEGAGEEEVAVERVNGLSQA